MDRTSHAHRGRVLDRDGAGRQLSAVLALTGLALAGSSLAAQEREVEVTVRPGTSSVAPSDTVAYESFRDALRNGQWDFAERHGQETPAEVAPLIDALRLVMAGDLASALTAFDRLSASDNEGVRDVALESKWHLLNEAGRWVELAREMDALAGGAPPIVAALAKLPRSSAVSAATVGTTATVSSRGQVALQGEVAGAPTPLYFDTGASITTLTDSTARRAGAVIVGDSIPIKTATTEDRYGKVGYISELRIGAVRIRHQPVLIFPDEDLTFTLDDGEVVVVSAILGWDAIRRLRTTLDLTAGTYEAVLADRPAQEAEPADVLTWFGYPMVRTHAESGQPLVFGLDTGSRNTSLTANIFRKAPVGRITADTIPIRGVGSVVQTPVEVTEKVVLRLGDHLVELRGAWTEAASGADDVFFFQADGVLGIDVAAGCRLEVDPTRARYRLEC